jgi:hypothetical protein
MLRLALALITLAILAFGAGVVAWMRYNIVPPDCTDQRTLALVHQSLTEHFHLPADTAIQNIQTHAGGYAAFRFVCEAMLDVKRNELPPDTTVPGSVHYSSQLSDDRQRQEVRVSIEPLLIWVPAE